MELRNTTFLTYDAKNEISLTMFIDISLFVVNLAPLKCSSLGPLLALETAWCPSRHVGLPFFFSVFLSFFFLFSWPLFLSFFLFPCIFFLRDPSFFPFSFFFPVFSSFSSFLSVSLSFLFFYFSFFFFGAPFRAIDSLTVPGGQELHFPNFFLKFQSIFLIFPQTLLIFFLILVFRVGDSPTREGPGYATGPSDDSGGSGP